MNDPIFAENAIRKNVTNKHKLVKYYMMAISQLHLNTVGNFLASSTLYFASQSRDLCIAFFNVLISPTNNI